MMFDCRGVSVRLNGVLKLEVNHGFIFKSICINDVVCIHRNLF